MTSKQLFKEVLFHVSAAMSLEVQFVLVGVLIFGVITDWKAALFGLIRALVFMAILLLPIKLLFNKIVVEKYRK